MLGALDRHVDRSSLALETYQTWLMHYAPQVWQRFEQLRLAEKVRKGGAGVWGPIPMPPHNPDKINDEDLKTSVDAILKS